MNNHYKIILLFIVVFVMSSDISLSQKVKIEKIIDSNLFELADGKLIKLAGVDIPNINHPDLLLQKIGFDAYDYAKQVLLGKRFEPTYLNHKIIDTNYTLVKIVKEYPLLTRDYSEVYISKGFGKFIANAEGLDTNKYIAVENEAIKGKSGIWEVQSSYDLDTLDQTFLGTELLTVEAIDTIRSSVFEPFLSKTSNTVRVLLETVSAPVGGAMFGFLGMLVGMGIGSLFGADGWGVLGYAIIGGYTGYITGNAAAVYYVAKNGERKVTFGSTFLYSLLGTITGFGISVITPDQGEFSWLNFAPLVTPGLASILYVNLIASKKSNIPEIISSNTNFNQTRMGLTHKDLYNSKKMFEINLLRIEF